MQGFGAQTHLLSEVAGPQQFERTKKKCPMDLRKLLTPFLLTPSRGTLNNANRARATCICQLARCKAWASFAKLCGVAIPRQLEEPWESQSVAEPAAGVTAPPDLSGHHSLCSVHMLFLGGAEMTIILSDNNSRIFTAP